MDLNENPNFLCTTCGSEKCYNSTHDAIYCELCNKWLEEKCNDPGCKYCAGRPDKPSQAD
jgi:hypothetical protein